MIGRDQCEAMSPLSLLRHRCVSRTAVPSCLSRQSVPPPSSTEVWPTCSLCLLPRQSNQSFRGPASLSSLPVGTSAAMAGGRLHPEAETAFLPLCLKTPAQLVPMFCPCLSRPRSCVLKQWPTRPSLAWCPGLFWVMAGNTHTDFHVLVRRKPRTELRP